MIATPSSSIAEAPNMGSTCQRWLTVLSHTDPRYGGLSTVVPRLGQTLAASGCFDVSLAAFCAPQEQFAPAGYDADHLSFWPLSRGQWLTSGALRRQLDAVVGRTDGVHIHGLWETSTAEASRAARRQRKPYVLSAHGMLEPWALNNKRLKKKIYAALIERDTVAKATCLHALTTAEAEQYRAFGARCPIAVVPNAVEVPHQVSSLAFLEAYPALQGKRLVLFLGRLHPKKGLDLLGSAWAAAAKADPEAHLVLAGPDAEGTEGRLRQLFEAAGISHTVTFTGMLYGQMKWSAMSAAECFVLPSFSEGLSMSVLEAMGAGRPVLVTRACNMPEVTAFEAGWEIEPNVNELRGALEHVLERGPTANAATGQRGAALVRARYSPELITAQMAEIYEFATGGRLPERVELLHA